MLGGYCCYSSLTEAIQKCINKVFVVTKIKRDNNLGIHCDHSVLSRELWKTLVYER